MHISRDLQEEDNATRQKQISIITAKRELSPIYFFCSINRSGKKNKFLNFSFSNVKETLPQYENS